MTASQSPPEQPPASSLQPGQSHPAGPEAGSEAGSEELAGLSTDPLWDTTALNWLTAPAPANPVHGVAVVESDGVAVQPGGGPSPAPVELMFVGVEPWVADILAPTFPRRATSQFRWCAQWWRHPEAVLRLEALWRSWEACRTDPMLGISGWLRDHLDPQLAVLAAPAGPFAECDPSRHFDPAEPALPLQSAPDGWWDTPGPDEHDLPAPDGPAAPTPPLAAADQRLGAAAPALPAAAQAPAAWER